MLRKVLIQTEFRGGDGRYRPGSSYAAIDVNRIVYLERTGTSSDGKAITTAHFDDGSVVDVLLSLDELIKLMEES